jgi:hypothetical protein
MLGASLVASGVMRITLAFGMKSETPIGSTLKQQS